MTATSETSSPSPQGSVASAVATAQQTATSAVDERPELAVGAAFAGGFLVAMILKRLGA
jgi:hypothetical protein